jgi:hypothetical protein
MKNPSRPAAFVGFFSATFWPAAMLRIALWAGQNVIYSRNVIRHGTAEYKILMIIIFAKFMSAVNNIAG